MPKENTSREGLDYWEDKPKDRIRESSGDPVDDEIRGILIGFKATLQARNNWMDIITSHQASREIRELIVKCGGDPSKYAE